MNTCTNKGVTEEVNIFETYQIFKKFLFNECCRDVHELLESYLRIWRLQPLALPY